MSEHTASVDGPGAARRTVDVPRFMRNSVLACRDITFAQWVWASGIGAVFLLAHVVGLLPPMLGLVPNVIGPPLPRWTAPQSVGLTVVYLSAAYCFLLAVNAAEHGCANRPTPVRRYLIAGILAGAAAVTIENSLYVLVPSLAPRTGGWGLPLDGRRFAGRIVWSTANIGLCGGLALAVYVRLRAARSAREAFNAAAMERAAAAHDVLACRLASLQAQIEPQFLLGTLTQIEALYEREINAGNRMLDALIDYLHAALPQLRTERSTLGQEARLAESYLRVVQIRMGSRLRYSIDVHPDLFECDFPPMLLLPLVDDALRWGLEPLPAGGVIVITGSARANRLRVRVADDGMPATARAHGGRAIPTLCERLEGLYGSAARLAVTANEPQGVIATVEVPHACTRDHR